MQIVSPIFQRGKILRQNKHWSVCGTEEFHSHSKKTPCCGSRQGNRGLPANWLQVLTMLLNRMIDETKGAIFQDPITKDEVNRIMDGFVDDMLLWMTLQGESDTEKLTRKLQEASQWWEELLSASGGKLELEKSFFYVLHWVPGDYGSPPSKQRQLATWTRNQLGPI